jgi:hypothetical protein
VVIIGLLAVVVRPPRLFERPPEEHPGKNGVTVGEREELGASGDATLGPQGPGVAAALLASCPSGGEDREAPELV